MSLIQIELPLKTFKKYETIDNLIDGENTYILKKILEQLSEEKKEILRKEEYEKIAFYPKAIQKGLKDFQPKDGVITIVQDIFIKITGRPQEISYWAISLCGKEAKNILKRLDN